MASIDKSVLFSLIILLSYFLTCVISQTQPIFGNKFCYDSGKYTVNSVYQMNLIKVLSDLSVQSSVSGFFNSTAGDVPNKVFGLYDCRGDMSPKQCNDCVKAAAGKILDVCPNQKEAIVWYQECMVRFSNQFIFALLDIEPFALQYTLTNYSDPLHLGLMLNAIMDGLIFQASYNSTRGFATGKGVLTASDTLYSLVQCTPDILGKSCEACLRIALGEMSSELGIGRVSIMLFLPSCQLRYSLSPYYLTDTAPPITALPPLGPALAPQNPPRSRPTIYHIPSYVPAGTSKSICASWDKFKYCIMVVLVLVVLPRNMW